MTTLNKFILLSLLILSFTSDSIAQNTNWGWGLQITVTANGSSIDCTVFDPVLNQNKSTNYSNANTFIYKDGVVAWVSNGGTVGAAIYDINLHEFKSNTSLSSISGTTITNSNGIVAWVSAGGTVGAATYNPIVQDWKFNSSLSSITGNKITNNDGVVAWVSAGGTVGAAVFDAAVNDWKFNSSLSSITGNLLTNNLGLVAWVSAGGTVGAAIYDPFLHDWKFNSSLSSITGNQIINSNGVLAWISTGGTIGAATYDPMEQNWKFNSSISSSSSNSNLTIEDGTVKWLNSNNPLKYGYDATNKIWKSNINTELVCKLYTSKTILISQPFLTYISCLSIGAANFSYACADGHTISRISGWKQFKNIGDYLVTLTISNLNVNSVCSQLISGFRESTKSFANKGLFISPISKLNQFCVKQIGVLTQVKPAKIEVYNCNGLLVNTINEYYFNKTVINLSNLSSGIYTLKLYDDKGTFAEKIVLN